MNVYDSARMADVMAPLGYGLVDEAADADLVILNTCHIREKADEKVYSDLGRIHKAQKKNNTVKKQLVAVGGCVGQAEGEEIIKRAPYVNMVFGPQSYHHLPEMVTKAIRGAGGIVNLDFPAEPKFDFLPEQTVAQGVCAFLSVQEGCDKFCTFCVVPYTRGAEYSRTPETILAEAQRMVEQGAAEITLLGQNVNAYHGTDSCGKTWQLGRLIRRLAEMEGLKRIRYTTSHPLDMDDDLIAAHGEVDKLMPLLHLPVQSGSDAVLARMNRKHKIALYMNVIEKLRAVRSDIAFSSDFIVGFPGENDIDFAATMKLVETVGFAQAYSYKYSPRPGTPAATDDKQVPEAVQDERLQQLQALITRCQLSYNQYTVGKTMPVLFDRAGKFAGQLRGKTPYMQSVYVSDAPAHYHGKIADVTITGAYQNSVSGLINNQTERKYIG